MAAVVALLALLFAASAARACTVSAGSSAGDFGSVSSLTVAGSTLATSAQPHAGIVCDGGFVVLLSPNSIVAVLSSSGNGHLVESPSGDQIAYRIFADEPSGEELFLGAPYEYYNTVLIDLLGLIGGEDIALPMSFRTETTANISAGTYTDTLTVNWSWDVCTEIGSLGLCLGRNTGSGASTINLALEVTPDCVIDAPDLDFGSAPLVAAFDAVTQTITVTCTKGSDYTMGLDDGMHASGATRRMAGGGEFLDYTIEKGASGTGRWGDTGAQRRASSGADTNAGTPDGTTGQGFDYRAEIVTSQSTPSPGTYTDMIVVDIAF